MNGFLERLAMRARGKAVMEGLPLVRPVPALYGSQNVPAPAAPMPEEPAGVPPAVPARELPIPSATVAASVEPERPQAISIRGQELHDQHVPIAPAGPRPAREQDRTEVIPVEAPAAMAPRAAEEQPRPPLAKQLRAAAAKPAPVEPGTEHGDAPRSGASREIVRAGQQLPATPGAAALERLFEAIEDVPAAGRQANEEREYWGRDEEAPTATPDPPVISIGRIDISVAPPVPREAPARTRGFDRYARVRRGLDR